MLDKRLSACADFVKGSRVCDIGTDHGYLTAELLLSGKCKTAVAADINEKPLASAKKTLEKHGLTDRCELILSDGLKNIPESNMTDIVIAGMGGELIASILSCCSWLNGINLVLQPMTQQQYLHKWLAENGFKLLGERAVADGHHIYTILNAEFDGIKRDTDPLSENIGALDMSDNTSAAYVTKQAEKLLRAGYAMRDSGHMREGAENISLGHRMIMKTGGKKMYTVKDILAETDKIAPLANLHHGDNSGLLVGDADTEVTSVLTALDITCDVVREAHKKGANVIVAHHPVIYNPLYRLSEKDPACLALKYGIACICFHSPLDMADGGINDIIYDMLKEPFRLSKPDAVIEPVHPDGRGYGMVCNVNAEFSPEKAAAKLKEIFGCTVVRYTNGTRPLKRLAFCSGGAGSDLPKAIALNADGYITGDVKHDQMITALNEGISLFDCGHYHTEVIAMAYLKKRFNEDYPDLSFEIADSNTDPVSYAL